MIRHLRTPIRIEDGAFGAAETLVITDTWQFDDYAKYVSTMFDPEKKASRRRQVFPRDCEKAFAMGARMATPLAGGS